MTLTKNILRAAKSAIGTAAESSNDNGGTDSKDSTTPPPPHAWPARCIERDELSSQLQARVNAEAAPRVAALEAQLRAVELELKRVREDWNVELGKIQQAHAAARQERTAAVRAEADAAITPLAKAWCTEPTRATALALIELLPPLAERMFDTTFYTGNELLPPCIARAFTVAIGIEPYDVARVSRHGEGLAGQVLPLAYRKDVTAFERILREIESALRAFDAETREQRAHGNVTRNYRHAG